MKRWEERATLLLIGAIVAVLYTLMMAGAQELYKWWWTP